MKQKRNWLILLGIILCLATLTSTIVLNKIGYLSFLDSDMAAEIMLARQQANLGHFIETQWMHSTEIRILSPNLLYAFSFLFTDSYALARIIGNTIGFVLSMAACVYLCRKLSLSYGNVLCTAALLPLAASRLYAAFVNVGGYYILHFFFGYLGAGLWLDSTQHADRRGKGLLLTLGYLAFCALDGLLSVRYVLCFVCPMLVACLLDMLFAPEDNYSSPEEHNRFFLVTLLGFLACIAGYVLSEIIYPHIFVSGVGAASSFRFNPLDGPAMLSSLMIVFADFLKLLGWRGGVSLFSTEGIVNLCIAATIVLGIIISIRVFCSIQETDDVSRAHKRMIRYSLYAFLVNLFCYIFIKGTYLNRYLIDAVLFFVPMLAIILHREKNRRLWVVFVLMLSIGLGTSSLLLLRDTARQEPIAQEAGQDMIDAADYLLQNGYTHGYGTFWHVRLMEERTEGKLTFTGVALNEAETGTIAPYALSLIRWGEMDSMSDLDICPQNAFLLLTHAEQEKISPWLQHIAAPIIFENDTYVVYGFESSQAFCMSMNESKMTLENTQALDDGSYLISSNGRLRVPPDWREAGSYTLSFDVEGLPQTNSTVRIYSGKEFDLIAEKILVSGENRISFTLPRDDKYSMMQILCGSADSLHIDNLVLDKIQ